MSPRARTCSSAGPQCPQGPHRRGRTPCRRSHTRPHRPYICVETMIFDRTRDLGERFPAPSLKLWGGARFHDDHIFSRKICVSQKFGKMWDPWRFLVETNKMTRKLWLILFTLLSGCGCCGELAFKTYQNVYLCHLVKSKKSESDTIVKRFILS